MTYESRETMKSNYVLVVDTDHVQQTPIHPAQARKLLRGKRAAILKRYPFTIILKEHGSGPLFVKPLRLKIDPGSKITGMTLLDGARVIWAAELMHRGQRIKRDLESRRSIRRGRRYRKIRYRKPRFLNRTKTKGWLAPSLMHRVHTTMTWVERLCRWSPVSAISMELVRFDTQIMENAEISGIEYQQGDLAGYEVREYLLEKFNRTCAYCKAKNTPFEIEHIVPRTRGGSNRISNLTLACKPCNQRKGNQTAEEFGHPDVQRRAKAPLKDAAAVNATRWRLWRDLSNTGHPLETGTGGRTKFNRTGQGLPKAHWLDAACVGASTPILKLSTEKPLSITSTGRGNRQVCQTDKYGFPKRYRSGHKRYFGFQTGDIAVANVPKGKHAGMHIGRVTVRKSGSFIVGGHSVNHKYCRLIQRADGYDYTRRL